MSGKLYTWGIAARGQLGNGTITPDVTSPAQIGALETWSYISASRSDGNAAAVKTDGTLWTWGESDNGRLGNGTTTPDVSTPAQIGVSTDWAAVHCSYFHSHAIKTGGTLWGWGFNGQGAIGDGSYTQRTAPVQVGADTWIAVTGSDRSTLGIKSNGTLWGWGDENDKKLGLGGAPPVAPNTPQQVGVATNWTKVGMGTFGGCGLRADGTIWTWGSNYDGWCGQGTTSATSYSTPTQVGALTTWASFSCGKEHIAALKTDGTLWAWGKGTTGQLGDGFTTTRLSPVQVGIATDWVSIHAGARTTFAIKADGSLWAWGEAANGGLGNGTTTPNILSPAQIGIATNWASVAAGEAFALAIMEITPPPNEFWTAFVNTEEIVL